MSEDKRFNMGYGSACLNCTYFKNDAESVGEYRTYGFCILQNDYVEIGEVCNNFLMK